MKRIDAPWTDAQVEALNLFQMADYFHPFTCPHDHGDQQDRVLRATPAGWVCPHCDYTQTWAHDFMLETWLGPPDWTCPKCGWREMAKKLIAPELCPRCAGSPERVAARIEAAKEDGAT
jgi:ssDNA-binding Zn-finger/Zn-ribbon topoisomerase 1